jgi:hypothetical protein
MTREEFLVMAGKARNVYVGVPLGGGSHFYTPIDDDQILILASKIHESNLVVEFGKCASLADILYVEPPVDRP